MLAASLSKRRWEATLEGRRSLEANRGRNDGNGGRTVGAARGINTTTGEQQSERATHHQRWAPMRRREQERRDSRGGGCTAPKHRLLTSAPDRAPDSKVEHSEDSRRRRGTATQGKSPQRGGEGEREAQEKDRHEEREGEEERRRKRVQQQQQSERRHSQQQPTTTHPASGATVLHHFTSREQSAAHVPHGPTQQPCDASPQLSTPSLHLRPGLLRLYCSMPCSRDLYPPPSRGPP